MQPTAHRRAGTAGAAAHCAVVRIATLREHFGRARAQHRLPVELRQQLLNAIFDGKPFPPWGSAPSA